MLCPKCGSEISENAKFCTKCGNKIEQPVVVAPQQSNLNGHNISAIWPEWQIEGKPLGKGSFGVVYKAVRRDHNVESYAAIKVISIPADPSEVDSLRSEGLDMNATRTYLQGIVNDFVSEIQLMESLKGVQNIVSVEDYKVVEKTGEIGWDIYIRMELLTPFNTHICDKKLTEEEVIKLGCDICTALEICGKRNIIHRDIKPENIFINDFGYFKLGDFGIARKMENMTGGLSQKGTFNYMAPEVATSSEYDARVDTYSLGIVLYRLLNGNRLPFLDTEKQLLNPNERRNAVDRRIRGEELPAPCDASPAMADLILRACAFDPDMRFASATEMKQALMSVASGTYQMAAVSGLDKTTSVRKAPADYDKTTSVRKAPTAPNQKSAPAVNTFGSTPKKKSKLPAIIAAVLAVVILIGVGIFAIPKFLGDNDSSGSGNSTDSSTVKEKDYSKTEEKEIAAIISEAEALANEEDYEGALAKVNAGLKTFPKSENLKKKSEEYNSALKAKVKADALENANGFAQQEDYLNAYKAINQAIATVGDDAELTAKATEYENAYVTDISSRVDTLIAENNISAAKELLRNGTSNFPNSDILKNRTEELNRYKSVSLSSLTPINGGFAWNTGVPGDPFGNTYTDVKNYTIIHGYSGYYSFNWDNCGACDDNSSVTVAEYKVDEQYDNLSLTIAPYSSFGQNGTSYFQVYVNGVLRYTSDLVVQKTQPYAVSVDISDATYIKIVATVGECGCIMLSDVMLSKSPDFTSTQEKGYTSLALINTFNGTLPWQSGYPQTTHTDKYTSAKNYAILHGYSGYYSFNWDNCGACDDNQCTYSAEYLVAKQYSYMSFDIAPFGSFGASGSSRIKVYADDVLIYSSPTVTQKTARFNTGNIDISQANYIKIVAEIDEHSCTIISDVLLKNA